MVQFREIINPVRNSGGAVTHNLAAASGPGSAPEGFLPRREGLWSGGSSGALFLTG